MAVLGSPRVRFDSIISEGFVSDLFTSLGATPVGLRVARVAVPTRPLAIAEFPSRRAAAEVARLHVLRLQRCDGRFLEVQVQLMEGRAASMMNL